MPGKIKTVRGLLLVMLALSLVLAACGTAQTAPTATPPIVYITQVVTQIIPPTPVPMTPTTPPTETPVPPSPTPTWDPLSAPIYYPIEGCVASRLHIGDKAMVSYVGGANGIRYDRDLSQDGVFAYAQPGAIHAAMLFELGDHHLGGRRRNIEADTNRSSGRGKDRGIHADDFAIHVEGGATRVAFVDGCVDLNVVIVGA